MTAPTANRIRRIVGVCLLIASVIASIGLARKLPARELWGGPVWLLVATLANLGLCVASAIGLLIGRSFGYWCLYPATALYLMTGATVPYLPIVLTFVPERLRTGSLALINLSITVLVFWLHYREHRERSVSTARDPG